MIMVFLKVPDCESPLKMASLFGEEMLHTLIESGVLSVPQFDTGSNDSIADDAHPEVEINEDPVDMADSAMQIKQERCLDKR